MEQSDMNHPSFPPAYTDHNTPSPDILFVLRDSYRTACPFLAKSIFDDLAENYAAEEPEDFLDALGQELTCYGHALYELSTDSDSYALVILPEKRIEEFKDALKAEDKKQKATQHKQARRKPGSPAKRINLGKRLPCDKMALAAGYGVKLTGDCIDEVLWLDYNMSTENEAASTRRYCSAYLDLKEWPPKQSADIELLVRNIAKRPDGVFAALVQKNAVNEKGYLSDKNVAIITGTDIAQIEKWPCVHKNLDSEWSAMQWFEGELFAADSNCVYHVKDVTDITNSCEKVLELKGGDVRWFPKFFVSGGRLYLFMHQSVYEWRKKSGLFKKGHEFKKVYTIDGFNAWDFVPVGDSKVAFQVRPKSVPRGQTESKLTLLDLKTGKESHYPCHYGYVRKWTEGRICVLPIDVTSKTPIIECFDFDSGERRNLMYGALGKDSVRDIYEVSCGTILEGREKNIYRTTELWEFMEEAKELQYL